MIRLFGLGLIFCPMLIGTVFLVLMKRLSRLAATHLGWIVMFLATISAFGFMGFIDQELPFTLTWIPGTGSFTFHISTTGLYAALITTGCGLFALSVSYVQQDHIPPATIGIMLITLAAANATLLSVNFLGRYVALEIVGGAVALLPFLALRDTQGSQFSKFVYFMFRIGDAGLLIAILILMHASGTLEISAALDAGASLEIRRLVWVVAAFLLAVWIKIGVWPFHGWQQTGKALGFAPNAWAYATVMPNLGLYLLYRITPLLALSPWIQQAVLLLGAFSFIIAMSVALVQSNFKRTLMFMGAAQGGLAICVAAADLKTVVWLLLLMYSPLRMLLILQCDYRVVIRSRNSRYWSAGFVGVGGLVLTLLNATLVWWIALSIKISPLLTTLLNVCILLFAYRCVMEVVRLLRQDTLRYESPSVGGGHPLLWIGPSLFLSALLLGMAFGFDPLLRLLTPLLHTEFPPLPTIFTLIYGWISDPVLWILMTLYVIAERRPWFRINRGIEGAAQTRNLEQHILTFAQTISKLVEMQFLEGVITRLPDALAKTTAFLHRFIEVDGLEGLLRAVAQVSNELGRGLQRWHTGKLRVNLSWVIVLLLLVVSALLLRSW